MALQALITGGGSGMGLAVAKALGERENWNVHILDINADAGAQAASSIGPNAQFHKVDCADYEPLAQTFDKIFRSVGRLDFVFANAGILERANFYEPEDTGSPPAPPYVKALDVNLRGIIWQTHLAHHYFRKNDPANQVKPVLVMTASCVSLYPSEFVPVYTAAKHGVLGLMRSIARYFYLKDGIRVNCICPGAVRTNIAPSWDGVPDEFFIPVEKIAEPVLLLLDGKGEIVDGKGRKVDGSKAHGLAVEVSPKNFYFRDQYDWCDDVQRDMMLQTATIEHWQKNNHFQ